MSCEPLIDSETSRSEFYLDNFGGRGQMSGWVRADVQSRVNQIPGCSNMGELRGGTASADKSRRRDRLELIQRCRSRGQQLSVLTVTRRPLRDGSWQQRHTAIQHHRPTPVSLPSRSGTPRTSPLFSGLRRYVQRSGAGRRTELTIVVKFDEINLSSKSS